ncbi:TRAPP subunit [Malassezia sp. CBS 17886]|nr:TRAPP subunit [Malassezia sp. CBS 17886]
MSYYFCVVGTRDNLLYEADLTSRQTTSAAPGAAASGSARTSSDGDARTGTDGRQSGLFNFGSSFGSWTAGLGGARAAGGAAHDAADAKLATSVHSERHTLQMIAHGALDVLEDMQFVNNAVYLKAMDRINEWTVSAFVVPGNVKFFVLHEHKLEDGIRLFLMDVWELWMKVRCERDG